MYKFAPALGVVLALGACTTTQFERSPVTVETEAGPVVCQLFLPEIVLWDTPISYPASMSKEDAVSACRQEGMARKAGGVVTATPL
ncbi:MAG: hypothetical protein ACK4YU_12535 [Paracoccus sp. (in: a-proteobacteria)]